MRNVLKRGSNFYFDMGVPKDLKDHIGKNRIKFTLGTSDPKTAEIQAMTFREKYKKEWGTIRHLLNISKKSDLENLILSMGFEPKKPNKMDMDEIIKRIAIASKQKDTENIKVALGQKAPLFILSELVDKAAEIQGEVFQSKTPHEQKKWITPRQTALSNLVKITGNINIKKLSQDHALKYYRFLRQRLNEDEIKPDTANKQISYIKGCLNICAKHYDLPDILVFNDLSFQQSKINKKTEARRMPFTKEWINEYIIYDKAINSIRKPEYRALIKILADTGARPKEICTLGADQIFLDATIPYIKIELTEKGGVKNSTSIRELSLVGLALEAFKEFPEGLGIKNTDSATSAINKNWRENNLLPEAKEGEIYSLYSQ